MKKRILLIVIVLLITIVFFRNFSFPVSKEEIIGEYENTNFTNPHCCVEAPHVPDRLILNSDYTFSSKFYGNGQWKLNGSYLELNYLDENGGGEIITYFTNILFEDPRILLNADLDHYYKKAR
jgi:hypothetical protein